MAESVTVDERKKHDFPRRSEHNCSPQFASLRSPSAPDQDIQRNLAVPFRGHIKGGMRTGKKVVVVGVVDTRPDRFYIGLSCGFGTSKEPPTDVALELGVRFKDHQVVRRACVSGTWGDTERNIPFFPFIKDQPFRIEIYCEHSRFRVLVDEQQLFDFNHRVHSLKDIDTLWITGSLRITKLG